jgi:hypothetical protein
MLEKSADLAIEQIADRLVHQEHTLVETGVARHKLVQRALLDLDASHTVQTDVGPALPSPEVSLRLLEHLACKAQYIARLSLRLTVDETFGCWALPLLREKTEQGISKYPLLTNKALGMKSVVAHRFLWKTLVDSDIPETTFLDHLCRTHACCNIAHLEPVTPQINTLRGNLARHIAGGQDALFPIE